MGGGCVRFHDRMMRDLQVNLIELDEQWDFVGKKQKRMKRTILQRWAMCWLLRGACGHAEGRL